MYLPTQEQIIICKSTILLSTNLLSTNLDNISFITCLFIPFLYFVYLYYLFLYKGRDYLLLVKVKYTIEYLPTYFQQTSYVLEYLMHFLFLMAEA